jgi:post-segregation antitoxin (ccd killing protein)
MPHDRILMTDEERRVFLEKWQEDNLASMTPFERYLYRNGLFDDVIRPEITA